MIFNHLCFKEKNKYFSILIPHLCVILANKTIQKNYAILKEKKFQIDIDSNEKEIIDFLDKYWQKELDRNNTVVDKAKSSLFVIALSITFLTGILKLFNGINPISEIYIIIGLIYFVLSGITSVSAILPRQYNEIEMDDVFKSENDKISFNDKTKEINDIYKNIKLNELVILEKINYVDVTFSGIIIGTFFISTALIIMLLFPGII